MPGVDSNRPRWVGLSGLGIELVGALVGLGLVGYWVGRHFGNAALGLVIGALLGLVGGMYNFLREALAAVHEGEKDQDDERR